VMKLAHQSASALRGMCRVLGCPQSSGYPSESAKASSLVCRNTALQEALTGAGCVGEAAVKEERQIHKQRPGFSGVAQPPLSVASCSESPPCGCPAATEFPCIRLGLLVTSSTTLCRVFLWRAACHSAMGIRRGPPVRPLEPALSAGAGALNLCMYITCCAQL
jgi:hypothetical protein